jgi:type VII secretion protein EccB
MQTPRDHVHAYRFMVDRMTSALVIGDPGAFEPPARRAWFGQIIGVVLGVVVLAGFAVYGLVVPGGNDAWQDKGVILLEKETGTRYVMRDGVLHPTPNQASALLLQGPGAKVETISRASLAGLRRGEPLGIDGAPDPVPGVADLLRRPPMLCEVGRPGGSAAMLVTDSTAARPVDRDHFLLARDPEGTEYVVWRGGKQPIADWGTSVALGLGDPVNLPSVWLDVIPDREPIAHADLAGLGERGSDVGGRRTEIGEVLAQEIGTKHKLYVVTENGLAPLTETEAALLGGREDAPPIRPVTSAEVAAAPRSPNTTLLSRMPDMLAAKPLDPSSMLCVRQTGRNAAEMAVLSGTPDPEGGVLFDLPPGGGILAAVPASDRRRKPVRYLITEQGRKYRITDDDAAKALGYGDVKPVAVATEVLSAIPSGPVLTTAVPRSTGEG